MNLNNTITMNLELIARLNIRINSNAARTFTITVMQQLTLVQSGNHSHQLNVIVLVMLFGGAFSLGILIVLSLTTITPHIISFHFTIHVIMENLHLRKKNSSQ